MAHGIEFKEDGTVTSLFWIGQDTRFDKNGVVETFHAVARVPHNGTVILFVFGIELVPTVVKVFHIGCGKGEGFRLAFLVESLSFFKIQEIVLVHPFFGKIFAVFLLKGS